MFTDIEIRFFSKVKYSNNCWEWQATKRNGYGQFWNGKRCVPSHRWSYQYFYGEMSKELLVCHHCDNPKCVNPFHLFLGTYRDNIKDAIAKNRIKIPRSNAEKTHCKRGHPFNETNTNITPQGWRHCRKCRNEAEKKRQKKLRLKLSDGSE